jgi:hypothetical protein
MGKVEHFDCEALVNHVHDQPIGLCVSTNQPAGFRRLLYLHMRNRPHKKVRILQAPESPNAFYLVKEKPNGAG